MYDKNRNSMTKQDEEALNRAKRYAAEDGYFGDVTMENAFITDPETIEKVREWREGLRKEREETLTVNRPDNNIESVTEKRFCPICNAELNSPEYAFVRYPNHVCWSCSKRTTDKNGRPLKFYNPYMSGHGCAAKYTDNHEDYGSKTCYIDGIECFAMEARYGGIVIQTKTAAKTDEVKAALFGVAVGDALGVPVEFKSRQTLAQNPITDMTGHGTHQCIARQLVRRQFAYILPCRSLDAGI